MWVLHLCHYPHSQTPSKYLTSLLCLHKGLQNLIPIFTIHKGKIIFSTNMDGYGYPHAHVSMKYHITHKCPSL